MNNYKSVQNFKSSIIYNGIKRMNVFFALIASIAFLEGCSNGNTKFQEIKWVKIYNPGEEIDFCQIDKSFPDQDQFIISYSSFPAVGGDLHIKRLKIDREPFVPEDLFNDKRSTLFGFKRAKNVLGFIQCGFRQNQIKTTLLLSFDNGKKWVEKKSPFSDLLKLYISDNILFVQGNMEGTGQLFKSADFGDSWKEITDTEKGYQYITLTDGSVSGNKLLCIGSSDAFRKNELFLLDIQTGSMKALLHINDVGNYIKPISMDKNVHAVISRNSINLYSCIDDSLKQHSEFYMPSEVTEVHNLFIKNNLYILTGENHAGNVVSWVSYENGKQWERYKQDRAYKLVYCPDGDLFMTDGENNILKGNITGTGADSGDLQ